MSELKQKTKKEPLFSKKNRKLLAEAYGTQKLGTF